MNMFPIGTVIDGRFKITDHIEGDIAYGLFRANSLGAGSYRETPSSYLVTMCSGLTDSNATHLETTPTFGLPLVGIFDIVEGTFGATALVEEEPAGRPSVAASPMPAADACALAISVIDRLTAHNAELAARTGNPNAQSQSLHPALVYVDDANRLTGLSLRWRRFFGAAKKPCHGAIVPFSDMLSPEQARGAAAAATSDSALVAQCLAYWVAGENLYDTSHPMAMITAMINGDRRVLDLPDTIARLIEEATSPDADARPPLAVLRDRLVSELPAD